MPDLPSQFEGSTALIVIGSINQDYFTYVEDFPAPGQTLLAAKGALGLGGKGANQAVAAAALGASVSFLGAVGDDFAGRGALEELASEGIDVTRVARASGANTGAAYITVSATGENTIIVDSGANALVEPSVVARQLDELLAERAAVVLCQGELRPEVVNAVARAARRRSARLVLNLAPVSFLTQRTLSSVAALVLNEGEAEQLASRLLGSVPDVPPIELAGGLADRLSVAVVITLGPDGAVVATADRSWAQRSPGSAVVVDTTGAGDAFTGALAAAMAAGLTLREAVAAGVVAGTIAVGSAGTTTSYARGTTAAALASRAPAVGEGTARSGRAMSKAV